MAVKKPAISVVIPAFNEEKYLSSCLESVKKQTFTDFEIIVVDNNSTDSTAEIARQYGARVVSEKVQGMIPARERGFKEAHADIIARTDADSVVSTTWLSQIFRIFEDHPEVVAITGGFTSFPGVNWFINRILTIYIRIGFYGFSRLLIGHYPLVGPNNALRKSVWQKVIIHADDKMVHEDMDLACHLAEYGEIYYYPALTATFSMRRWKKRFLYTLVDYGIRYFRTIHLHHPWLKRHKKILTENPERS